MGDVTNPDNKYFPAIIVAIIVGILLFLMLVMWGVQQYVKRTPKHHKDSQSYYPDNFYRGFNKRKPNTRRENVEEVVEKGSDGSEHSKDSAIDLEQRLPRPLPRIRTDNNYLPRPETLYSPTRPNSTLLLDEFVAPLFGNNNNHSQSNLLRSSQNSHDEIH
ncbi:hypothetical protein E3P77_02267 [Wallemia ichthyophaga]|nr:hypothetical protein E3P77_02267 [Wallemia ichthyophaga]